MEDYIRENLEININFVYDNRGNIINTKASFILPIPEKQIEYETAGVPYIREVRTDSNGNKVLIYETNVNRKDFTENKIRDEHGLQNRGEY